MRSRKGSQLAGTISRTEYSSVKASLKFGAIRWITIRSESG